MPVFKLTPIDLTERVWQASTYKGPCLIHAEDERHARQYAKMEFWQATNDPSIICPWMHPGHVDCREIIDQSAEQFPFGVVLVPDGEDGFKPLDGDALGGARKRLKDSC